MLTIGKITEIYCIADEFCKNSDQKFKNLKNFPKILSYSRFIQLESRVFMSMMFFSVTNRNSPLLN